MRRMQRALTIAAILFLAACSSDAGTGSSSDSDAGGNNGADGPDAANAASNGATNNANSMVNGATNGTTNGATNGTTNGTTNGATNGMTNNMPDMGMTTDMAGTGEACDLNSQCTGELICCPGIDGMGSCETDCLTGGLCGGDQTECSTDAECCDLSDIGGPDTCLAQCGGGGEDGTPCDTNPDCEQDEVCCLGFDGSGECVSTGDCITGGACEQDADCRNGQECCDFGIAKSCLDQCRF